jgi:hypothetical protein
MEIIVPKSEFKTAIGLARKALSKVVIQEERGHLLFIVSGPDLIVQGTNNDLKARCTIPITNVDKIDYSFTADPKILEKLISKVEVKDIRVDFNKTDYIVKVYTTEGTKSFSTLQSFPPDKMLTFENNLKMGRTEYVVSKSALVFSLEYAENFMAPKKEDQKQYDFVIISKGIVFSANGLNKLGFIAFKTFESIPEIKIRKLVLPTLVSFAGGIEGNEVKLIETDKDVGIESPDGKFYFSFLKSTLESPKIPKEYLKSEGAYTRIDKSRLLKLSDRVLIASNSMAGAGLELVLSGVGESACLEIKLLSTRTAVEAMTCIRVNDTDQTINHVVDHRMLKAVVGSFETDKEIRLHINDQNKFFKIYSSGEVDNQKYVLAGVGTYAKIIGG